MNEKRIATKLGTLAFYELGDGPATLLWPSLYVDHASLVPLANLLATSRRCILLDGPGHGRSDVPSARFTQDDCAAATLEVLDTLGIPQVDWIGNAWGGHVGIHAALTSPSRVRSLTVIGAPMQALEPHMPTKSRMALALMRLGAMGVVGGLIAKAMISPASDRAHHEYVRHCMRAAPKGGIPLAVRSISLGRADLIPELPRITVPTLFIAGADDAMWPPTLAREQAALIPGARCETVRGAAHLVPLECPAETAALVTSFLAARATSAA